MIISMRSKAVHTVTTTFIIPIVPVMKKQEYSFLAEIPQKRRNRSELLKLPETITLHVR